MPLTEEELRARVEVYRRNGNNYTCGAAELGIGRNSFRDSIRRAARLGLLLDHTPAMPGFEITKVSTNPAGGQTITQVQEGEDRPVFEIPSTHFLGKLTVNRDAEGRVIQDWIRVMPDDAARDAAMRATIEAFKAEMPRAEPVPMRAGSPCVDDRLNQYTITDLHFGQLSWKEETGESYDLKIAEQLVLDWFSHAIKYSPDAHTAVLAQIGDLLHFDGLESVTPAHRNVLDTDSRFSKIVRVVIRTLRRIITMLLEKHAHVHIIMADANHDPASEVWLREMFASFYEDEPRVSVDTSPVSYYAYEWGLTSLFYHHGHKKKIGDIDTVWAGMFREMYGRTKFAYGHMGHLHSDELKSGNLMKVERHETLATRSSFEANGGWISGRSAKVITYSKRFGEVGRLTITPEMVTS